MVKKIEVVVGSMQVVSNKYGTERPRSQDKSVVRQSQDTPRSKDQVIRPQFNAISDALMLF